ncbi:preprotein translocase subunit TatC [Thiomicrospira aerophila AL3]|uniref:Sec-independent protein translocase protein TatC n=1 Tax=Thiomicrospira aerophila AL3 TaxID=717772 RepID=W0DU96_9GAMM|nr:twin-arginine translocase subunit TatC [Thiomicrospira aerophila]AHF02017.1 preprotein translocase subunit TatC [Thiomicrospira aerophila AL3]
MKQSALPPNDQEMTLVQHLLELRNAVTKSVIAIAVMFLILFPFANDIYTFIAEPLTRYLPDNTSMIAVGVASPFLTPFKLSLVLAIYLAMPFLLYQLWSFIAPALYSHEKQLIGPVLFFSSFLFYAGGAFSYFVVFPLVFGFLSQTAPDGVTIATDIALYLDFVIKMFFAFGLAFEVPVITVLLILTGMVKPKTMSHARPYVIVAAFVLGMLLTPPDIISQTLLAVPVWLLYELGIIIGTFILKRKGLDKEEDETNDNYEHEPSSKSYQGSAQKFDRGFAEQNSKSTEDDFDFDSEFDKIEREMAALRDQSNASKSNDSKGKSNDDQQEPKRPNT